MSFEEKLCAWGRVRKGHITVPQGCGATSPRGHLECAHRRCPFPAYRYLLMEGRDRALWPPTSGSWKLLRTRGGVLLGSSQGQAVFTRGDFQTMVPTKPKTPTLTGSPKEFIPQMEATVPLPDLHPPPPIIPSLHSKIALWLINTTCRIPRSELPGPQGQAGFPFTAPRVLCEVAFLLPPWPGAQSRNPLPRPSASRLAEWWLQSAGTLPSGRKLAKRAAPSHWGSWEQNQVRITQQHCEICKTSWFHFCQEAHSPPEAESSPNPRQPAHSQRTLIVRVIGLGTTCPSPYGRPSPSLAPSLSPSSPSPGEVGPVFHHHLAEPDLLF